MRQTDKKLIRKSQKTTYLWIKKKTTYLWINQIALGSFEHMVY